MRHKKIPFTALNDDRICYNSFDEGGDTNRTDINRMKSFLSRAMVSELTEKQHYCLEQYFGGRKMKDIAKELGVNPSTVTRTIQRSIEKLKKATRYYH